MLRDFRLIHDYFGINLAIVWDVVQNKLGALETVCGKLQNFQIEATEPELENMGTS